MKVGFEWLVPTELEAENEETQGEMNACLLFRN